jgi:hypothetical protein
MRRLPIICVVVLALLLGGCSRQATQAAAPAAQTPKAYPVESQLDKFEIRPSECAGEIEELVQNRRNRYVSSDYLGPRGYFRSGRLYYEYSGDPATGGAALDMSSKELTEQAYWHQSMDVNGDGLCDYLATSFSGASSWGQALIIRLRKTHGTSIDRDFSPDLSGEFGAGEDKSKYFTDGSSLPSRIGGPMPLPGAEYVQTIVYRIHPKAGGTPYIVVANYDYTAYLRPDFKTEAMKGGGYEYSRSSFPNLYVFRWDPAIKKFRELRIFYPDEASPEDGPFTDEHREFLFGQRTAEYWSVRAYIAERHLADALKAFKARDYAGASRLMNFASAADPRNPDLWGWRGALHYASGEFNDAAGSYRDAIAWTEARRLSLPPILHFNQGMALEAVCWKQIDNRREGEKPGCAEEVQQEAMRAYERYLKAAPQGERAAEARARLADLAKGVVRAPQIDPELARSADAIDRMAKALAQTRRKIWQQAKAREEAEQAKQAARQKPAAALDPETGQPVGAPTRDVFKLSAVELKQIDTEINRLLKQKGKTYEQSRIDWMIAYKAKFPQADLADLIERPEHYEALPWVRKWRATYSELPR